MSRIIYALETSLTKDIIAYCQSNGIRSGTKRVLVAQYLIELRQEADGDFVWRSLKQKKIKISVATVYNALNWLHEAGFVEKKAIKDKRFKYSLKKRFLVP